MIIKCMCISTHVGYERALSSKHAHKIPPMSPMLVKLIGINKLLHAIAYSLSQVHISTLSCVDAPYKLRNNRACTMHINSNTQTTTKFT